LIFKLHEKAASADVEAPDFDEWRVADQLKNVGTYVGVGHDLF
jgi:hypothetical protein